MNDLPFVRKGQPITAVLWNQLCAAVRACRLIAGDGVRLREMPDGTIITFDGDGAEFVHPFQVSLIGNEAASIRPGTVNKVDARIKDVPLVGKEGEAPPVLKFGQPTVQTGLMQPLCKEQLKPFRPSNQSRTEMLTRINRMALDLWTDVRTPRSDTSQCTYCVCRHACSKFKPVIDRKGKKRIQL